MTLGSNYMYLTYKLIVASRIHSTIPSSKLEDFEGQIGRAVRMCQQACVELAFGMAAMFVGH